jgi:hypothetical protein
MQIDTFSASGYRVEALVSAVPYSLIYSHSIGNTIVDRTNAFARNKIY